ncbi:MAG: ABC transporter ATP-binding protein [Culicoidibacterales bacterium]
MSSLTLHNISKRYLSNTYANKNINTSFTLGEIVAIIGHNGAGKTTLLNQIIGVTKPDSGAITFNGYSFIKNPTIARKFTAIMPQLHAPLTGVTMSQSIQSILKIRGFNHEISKQYTSEILDDLKITAWSNKKGDDLSGGLQRLTSFAMTVAAPPPIILLDEPTNDVDPIRRKLIWKHLKKLANKGHIIIVVTHNLLEVEQYAQRYIWLHKGEIIQDLNINPLDNSITSSMILSFTADILPDNLPVAQKINYNPDSCLCKLELEKNQILPAIDWLLVSLSNKQIYNFTLSPISLDDIYGGILNEH